jgi:hypothetical protein
MSTNTQRSTAAQIQTMLWEGAGDLNNWESMKILLTDWMEEEMASLRKYRTKLEQADDPKNAGKLYKIKIRMQNYQAAIEVLDGMYQHLFSMHERAQGLLRDLIQQDRKYLQAKQDLQHFYAEAMHMHEYSAILTRQLLARHSGGEDPAAVRQLITSSDTFRQGVEVLIANDINTL